jgi:hypothetical protein
MENISGGPTFGNFVTIRTEATMQDITVARLQSTRVQTPHSPLSPLLNVIYYVRVSGDSQNIPYSTLQKRGSWLISVYL